MEEPDDTSSNPNAELHLPASGEFDADNIKTSDPLTDDDSDEDMAPGANAESENQV